MDYLCFWRIVGIRFFVVLTRMNEEVSQIHVKNTVCIFGEADGARQRLIKAFRNQLGIVNAAKINEIESGASHNEHGLKVIFFGKLCNIVYLAAAVGQLKLTHSHKHVVNRGAIGQGIGAEENATSGAIQFLICLALDGKDF